MAARSGESKAGLVAFLVIFILVSITLGVTTYLGYGEVGEAKKHEDDAKKEAGRWTTDANYWKFLALTYRSYLGLPPTKDPSKDSLAELRDSYDKGSFKDARDENKEDHKKAITETFGEKTALKWDPQLKKPSRTYQDDIDALKREVDAKDKAAKAAQDDAKKANDLAESTRRELEAAKAEFAANLAKQKKDDDTQRESLQQKVTSLQKELEAKGEVALKELGPLQDENKKLRGENKKLNNDLTAALKTIRDRGLELARTSATEEIDVTKLAPENLAKVVSINGAGDMPYISLGSADNLRRQVTFSIYGRGVDGRPLKEPKGRLEVVRIAGEHLAQARITDLRDEKRDPVLPGDFIFNPAWNSNLKQHVAIIGTIDLTGEGHDDIQEFIRNLKNQNVEVDAWMDMKAHKLNGSMTRQTDLLIVGGAPNFGSGTVKADDPIAQAKDQTLKEMQKVLDDAEKLGVRIVRLNSFLEMSGYPLPKTAGADRGKIQFHRNLPAAGSPVERRETPPK
jgi:hypothetical protein